MRHAIRGSVAIDELQQLSGEAAHAKMRELLALFPIAFMVTGAAGRTNARPIGVVGDHAAFDGTLWFITDRRSEKIQEIALGPATSLIFQNDARGIYLYLRGRATAIDDREQVSRLYTPVQRTWFPDGPDDPNLLLIRFDAEDARYWEGHQSRTRLALAFVKSVVTGEPGRSGDAGVADLR
jgi:general stress protein 26